MLLFPRQVVPDLKETGA